MKVAIGIITYNRFAFFSRCYETVLAAKKKDWLFFVADDMSDDSNVSFLEEEAKNFRVQPIFGQTRGGVAKNSNRIIKAAKQAGADVLFLLNDDIEVRPGAFEIYLDAIEKTGYHHFCYGDPKSPTRPVRYFEKNGVELKQYFVADGAFVTITKDMMNKLGGFSTVYGLFGCEHMDYSLRASQNGFSDKVLDVAEAEGKIIVQQYYMQIPVSLPNRNQYLSVGVPKWLENKTRMLDPHCHLICD